MPERPPALQLSVQLDPAAGECPVDRRQLRRWVLAALARDARITLRMVGVEEARDLNARFRARDYPTNVLTFAYGDAAPTPAPDRRRRRPEAVQADVVICLPVVRDEAREQGKSARDHLGHLVVHGVLHAQGMDHEDERSAALMEAREADILHRFRIDDPYRTDASSR
jgi:probable rRNA maturation factor